MSRRAGTKLYAALQLVLAAMPLFLLPAAVLLPGREWLGALLPVPALLFTFGAGLLSSKRRLLAFVAAVLAMAGGCAACFLPAAPLALALFLPCLLLMLLFMPAMARPAHQEWSAAQLGFGVGLHVAAQFIKTFDLFAAVAAPLTWLFAAYMAVFLFSLNRGMLMNNSPASYRPLLSKNRVLLAALCLAALLLSNLKSVIAAVRAAVSLVVAGVMSAILWIMSLFAVGRETASTTDGGNPFSMLMEDAAEPSLLSRILETALIAVAALAAAALLLFALRQLLRLLKRLFRTLMNRLQLYRQRIAADYTDQAESLLDWGELRKTAQARVNRVKRRYLPTPWEKLSPAQRVRRVYALLLRRPEPQNPALTARETLLGSGLKLPPDTAAALAALYDQARYSDHPIAPQDADAMRKRAGV